MSLASPARHLRRFAGLDRHIGCSSRQSACVLCRLSLQRHTMRLRNGAHNVAQLRRGAGCQLAEQREAVVVHLECASAYQILLHCARQSQRGLSNTTTLRTRVAEKPGGGAGLQLRRLQAFQEVWVAQAQRREQRLAAQRHGDCSRGRKADGACQQRLRRRCEKDALEQTAAEGAVHAHLAGSWCRQPPGPGSVPPVRGAPGDTLPCGEASAC